MTKIIFSAFLIILSYVSYSNTKFYRCSYRDDPSSTIVIGWCNDGKSTNAIVCYDSQDFGTEWKLYSKKHGIDRTENLFSLNHNFARITGLTPNTIYYFVIHDDEGISSRMSFKTLSDNSAIPITFISGGDSRTGLFIEYQSSKCRPRRQEGNKLVAKIRPDFVAFNGDYIFDVNFLAGINKLWADWFEDWQLTIGPNGRITPIVPTFGNHELSEYVYKLFDIPNKYCYYSLGLGGNLLRIYSINSETPCDSAMLFWLTNDLQLNTGNINEPFWKIIQYHKSLVSHAHYAPEINAINCWENLFSKYKIRIGIEGHSHIQKITYPIIVSTAKGSDNGFIRDDSLGTVYIGEGCWGAPMRKLKTDYNSEQAYNWTKAQARFAGFNIVTVRKSKIEIRTVKFENELLIKQVQETDSAGTLPQELILWETIDGKVVNLTNNTINIKNNFKDENYENLKIQNNGFANIKLPKPTEDAFLEVYNALGHKINFQNIKDGTELINLDFSEYSKGNYFVFVKGRNIFESLKVVYSN